MTRNQKLIISRIALSAILFVVLMLVATSVNLQLTLFLIPYLIIGYDVLWAAVRNILRGHMLDEKFLMSIATVGAIILGEYPEALAVMLFYQVGELFLDLAVNKSRRSISELMDICPDYARVLRDNTEVRVEPYEVEIGETIVIRPGERIPLDGVILSGNTAVDTSALTGESLPCDKADGDTVVSGTVNLSGVIRVEVTEHYDNSTVSRILELVESAADKKAKVENFITRFARVYTPIVVVSAILLAVIPSIITGMWAQWIHRALLFLVVSCPCALVISVPLSFFGGIGGASRKGILIKGSNYLEQLANVKTVVFDKTGTLTYGNFEVTEICPVSIDKDELLRIAATAEQGSNHPIAKSISNEYKGKLDKVSDITEIAGKGIIADDIACGNIALMEHIGVDCRAIDDIGTVVYVARGREYLGHILISDKIKENSIAAISDLHSIKRVMLTGDRKAVGEAVGRELGIDEIYTDLLPNEKVEKLEELLSQKKKGESLCYVGDGINDAPVLATADVGIAMGALGSDAAIEAADIVLMDDDPLKVSRAIRISKFTVSVAKQNIIFALTVKGLVLVLGALGIAGMWAAVFADVGVSVLATLNAMRCMKN